MSAITWVDDSGADELLIGTLLTPYCPFVGAPPTTLARDVYAAADTYTAACYSGLLFGPTRR